jgi:hypothetical protein
VNFAAIYGTGAVLGFSPREVDEMSFDEFAACVDGFNQANGSGKRHPRDMTDQEMDEGDRLLEEVERRNAARRANPDGN